MLRFNVLVCIIFLVACGKHESKSELFPGDNTPDFRHWFSKNIKYTSDSENTPRYNPKRLVKFANKYVGTRYRAGGTTPGGFDCSGFTLFVHKKFGIYLPSSSKEMASVGVKVKLKNILPGDLIFFKGENKRDRYAGHVGIVVSNPGEPVKFIHTSSSKGVRYDVLEESAYFQDRFMYVRRIVEASP